ncbi:hypothetical protein [Anaeromicrobium sediminis]|uniref:Uncharacterized protein n=1 Tax=Anaeromicrobium sediminis TaxID=1478221 RepID=A0A267MQU6_9FIRM|nr:hypothetical protein [Anaeromicrobium sediminis]PAB61110.1 hypothetical protein CCE28_01390 [Anaeromicrobium sediminis]
MNKIKVRLIYPADFELDMKDIELTQTELIGLMMSDKIGSEDKYFLIEDKIFEDVEDGKAISIILTNSI